MVKGRGEDTARGFDFNESPWDLIPDDEEINLAFLLVPNITELELAKPQVRPGLDGFEKVPGGKCFATGT